MDIENLIAVFERKLSLQRYSVNSIKNYSSVVRSFLQMAEKRFHRPDELSENEIEKYVYWKIRKDHVSSSYQRMIVASIDKFYSSVVGKNLNIKYHIQLHCLFDFRYRTLHTIKGCGSKMSRITISLCSGKYYSSCNFLNDCFSEINPNNKIKWRCKFHFTGKNIYRFTDLMIY